MRHNVRNLKLGKDRKHRIAMLRNLTTDLIEHERLTTTVKKAKLLKSFAEKIINRAKEDTLHNRRIVYKNIKKKPVLKKLFEDIGKRFQTRDGGYTRIIRMIQRKGDAADMCMIELVEEKLDTGSVKVSGEKATDFSADKKHENSESVKGDVSGDDSSQGSEGISSKVPASDGEQKSS